VNHLALRAPIWPSVVGVVLSGLLAVVAMSNPPVGWPFLIPAWICLGHFFLSLSPRNRLELFSEGFRYGAFWRTHALRWSDVTEFCVCDLGRSRGQRRKGAGLVGVRQRMNALPRDADFTRWLEWFFADRSTRLLSPYSKVTVPAYVKSCAAETNETCWQEALMFCPTNGLAFAQMARHHLQRSKAANSPDAARADWESRQAVRFAPGQWESWHQRQQFLEHTGGWTDVLAEAESVIQVHPNNHYAWNFKGVALQKSAQWDAAILGLTRALEIGNMQKRFDSEPLVRRYILLGRANSFRQSGRLAEAAADTAASYDLAPRDPGPAPTLSTSVHSITAGRTKIFRVRFKGWPERISTFGAGFISMCDWSIRE